MTVEDLRNTLADFDPGPEVIIPCPHCCGQSGTDFDILNVEGVSVMPPDGIQKDVSRSPLAMAYSMFPSGIERKTCAGAVLLGRMDQECLEDSPRGTGNAA